MIRTNGREAPKEEIPVSVIDRQGRFLYGVWADPHSITVNEEEKGAVFTIYGVQSKRQTSPGVKIS